MIIHETGNPWDLVILGACLIALFFILFSLLDELDE